MADKDNIAKDVTTMSQLQEQLQISAKEGGIAVLDVYSTKWGFCRAIAPTFRRLLLEADESTKLRFLTADCTTILADYAEQEANAAAQQQPGAPATKSKKDANDTSPDFWIPILRKQDGKAKPLFLFFKEGKLVNTIEGCQTPKITNFIKDISTVKTPADEYIHNPALMEVWSEYFNAGDSETSWEKFMAAMAAICKLTVPLNDAESTALKEALHVKMDQQHQTVHAENLQKWVGDGTVLQAFTALLPNYEERAVQERIDKEKAAAAAAAAAAEAAAAAPPTPPPAAAEGASQSRRNTVTLASTGSKSDLKPAGEAPAPAAAAVEAAPAPAAAEGEPAAPPAE